MTSTPHFERITGGRQQGKTTALLHIVAELQPQYALVVIIVPDKQQVDFIRREILKNHPGIDTDGNHLEIRPVARLHTLRGRWTDPLRVAVVVDNWDQLRPDARREIIYWPWSIKAITETV